MPRSRSRRGVRALCASAALCAALAPCARASATLGAGAGAPIHRSAVVAFAPLGGEQLGSLDGLSIGLMSATQGSYQTAQLLLDIGQGARIAAAAYPERTPRLSLSRMGAGAGATVAGWPAALVHARQAPALLVPGLLASVVPGGGAYAGTPLTADTDAIVAADRGGRVARFSVGSAASLPARVALLARAKQLVVCDLPGGELGLSELRALVAARAPGELLLVVQRVRELRGVDLVWAAAAGLSGTRTELRSPSTKERGLIASFDLAPTILAHLRLLPPPAAMRGAPIESEGPLQLGTLRALKARLEVIAPRRLEALAALVGAWALILLVARGRRARAFALRAGALAVLWSPALALLSAAIAPGAAAEYALIAAGSLLLGALTDAFVPWPRAPVAPALVILAALVVDALAGSQLLTRSLIGPAPALGARFYGFGNELKSALAVLVLVALAAILYPARRSRRSALLLALTGAALAVIEGSARLGAGVGGAVLVSAGFALASVMLLPGAASRRRALLVVLAPLLALALLAALDLAFAHGGGHYTGSILHARSLRDVRAVLVRRYDAAWRELSNHAMPVATALAALACALGVRLRERLLAPVRADPAWLAAFAGGLAAGVVGAFSEDSGPELFVIAAFVLGCAAAYLWGGSSAAPARRALTARTPDTARAELSRAPARAAEPAR